MSELKQKIEAILFAAGRTVTLQELCKLCRVKDPAEIQQTVEVLKQELQQRNSPLFITAEVDGWKMTVGEKHLTVVREITPHTELSKAFLETLAVIAWKQPILQAEVIKIRTSGAYEHIAELLKLGFINKNRQGRSYALKVTGKFFEYFDLPGHEALKAEFEKIQQLPELQQLIGEQKLGELQVYPVPPEQAVSPREDAAETLGKLEVFDEPALPAAPQPEPTEPTIAPDELRAALQAAASPAAVPESALAAPVSSDEPVAEEPAQEPDAPEEPPQAEPAEETETPARKLPAALDSFADEGKEEWGKDKEKAKDEDADEESESGLDKKL